VKGFGCRPSPTLPHEPGPAFESRQRRKSRDGIDAAVAQFYGDLTAPGRAIDGVGWGRVCRSLGLIRQNGLFG
jgi:hypothetical protein